MNKYSHFPSGLFVIILGLVVLTSGCGLSDPMNSESGPESTTTPTPTSGGNIVNKGEASGDSLKGDSSGNANSSATANSKSNAGLNNDSGSKDASGAEEKPIVGNSPKSATVEKRNDGALYSEWGLFDWLLWIPIVLIALALVIALGFYLWSLRARSVGRRRRMQAQIKDALTSLERDRSDIKQLSLQIKHLNEKMGSLTVSIDGINKKLKNLGNKVVSVTAVTETVPVEQQAPLFPASVEMLIERYGGIRRRATFDPIIQKIVENPEKEQEFFLVEDGKLESDEVYAFPVSPRLRTKGEYLNFFQTVYGCDAPASGEIWIRIPAVLRKGSDGWSIEEVGDMETR